jgi:L,D-peptidoglycan transpeptidase YkuD (ErfK/YbiS/YcfS/YnhG family)
MITGFCSAVQSYSKKRVRNEAGRKFAGLRRLTVRARPAEPTQGLLIAGPRSFRCALGRGGISARKREGDGATPLSAMRLLGGYFRRGRIRPASGLPLAPIGARDGWCDAPADRNYNRPVRLPYPVSHEEMRRPDRLYDAVIVLDWNIRPRRRNRGSAIFLHVAKPGFRPTEGCVAVAPAAMAWLLPRISRRTVLRVVR